MKYGTTEYVLFVLCVLSSVWEEVCCACFILLFLALLAGMRGMRGVWKIVRVFW